MKLLTRLLIYATLLILYYSAIRMLDTAQRPLEVLLFDYPRHGTVLASVFFLCHLAYFITDRNGYNRPYPFVLLWLPFLLFLAFTALVFFYGFMSIGAPFRYNVFAHLFIAHVLGFCAIRSFTGPKG